MHSLAGSGRALGDGVAKSLRRRITIKSIFPCIVVGLIVLVENNSAIMCIVSVDNDRKRLVSKKKKIDKD